MHVAGLQVQQNKRSVIYVHFFKELGLIFRQDGDQGNTRLKTD